MTAISPTASSMHELGPYVEEGDAGPYGRDRVVLPTDWRIRQRRDERRGLCSHCGTSPGEQVGLTTDPRAFLCCARCNLAVYCSKVCQQMAWKAGHINKAECKRWQAEIKEATTPQSQ